MIEVKISGLKVADYWSPTDGWNYDAIDSLAKELCDRYREAEAERTIELFKKYIERMSILHEINPLSIDYIRDKIEWMVRPLPLQMTNGRLHIVCIKLSPHAAVAAPIKYVNTRLKMTVTLLCQR